MRCSRKSGLGPGVVQDVKFTNFYLERVNGGYKLSFTLINGHRIFSEKTVVIPAIQNGGAISSILESEIDYLEGVTITNFRNDLTKTLLNLSWRGTDPGDAFKNIEVVCE